MTSWYREWAELEVAEYDPLCVERGTPMDDDEASAVEALCHASTPGPMVLDDHADGGGAPVCGLPDGRMVVSRTATVESAADPTAIGANAELICKARYYLLRLLRDRQQWQSERQALEDRIANLEAQLATPRRPR
ncbi:MAG: hypothetical protein U1E05_23485 [Patescibacteria group bacterium]|nr:hypothetical protein [Patescibacteria group bacterium]